eukprot:c38605_g1_i1 orf=53-322(-)
MQYIMMTMKCFRHRHGQGSAEEESQPSKLTLIKPGKHIRQLSDVRHITSSGMSTHQQLECRQISIAQQLWNVADWHDMISLMTRTEPTL